MSSNIAYDRNASVYVDKEGIVHWDGDPAYGEEFEQRTWLAYYTHKQTDQKMFPLRIMNGLAGRAWRLSHKRPELEVSKLLESAAEDSKATVTMVITTIRASCEKVAPLRKKEAFNNFFRKGYRKSNESVQE